MEESELTNIELIIAIVVIVCLLAVLGLSLAVAARIKDSRGQVRRMGMPQKVQILNELAAPFGFFYDEKQGVFTSRLDAWQRKQGYEDLFDRAATGLNMVLDAWPVHFDYEGRTWLIELWKGQYGINTGGEIGIYHAKDIVPEVFYKTSHFDAAEDDEMPQMICRLERKGKELYRQNKEHWWLTGFQMGSFSKPSELRLTATLHFREQKMAVAFYRGLVRTGVPKEQYHICRNEVSIDMNHSPKTGRIEKLHRIWVLFENRIFCRLFRIVTWPFKDTVDRMLFLYYLVPSCFRRMLHLKKNDVPKRGMCRRRRCA